MNENPTGMEGGEDHKGECKTDMGGEHKPGECKAETGENTAGTEEGSSESEE